MKYAYGTILFVFSILAFYFSTRIFYRKKKEKHNIAFSITAFGSGVWSLGYGLMFLFDDINVFLAARTIGLLGLFLFIIAAQFMIGIVAGFDKKVFYYFDIEIIAGIIVLILVGNSNCIDIYETESGYITAFKSQAISIIYTSFIVWVAISFIFISVKITGKNYMKHIRYFGRNQLLVEALIILGMIIDTILPAFGINYNIPTSSMFQFIGLQLIYFAVHKIDSNRINFQNMAGYIYQSLRSPILIFDRNNVLNIVNAEANKVFDFTVTTKLNEIDFWQTVYNMNPPENIENSNETIIIDAVYKEKEMHCRLYIDSIKDEYKDFIGYIVMISDMTALVNNTKELEESKNEALRANKAKSQFLANMSHEIRTPMNSIIGFSEVALSDDINDSSREYFEDINRSAQSLLNIINDILDISKIESGKMELITSDYKTEDVFKEVTRIIKMQAYRKKLDFIVEIPDDFPYELHGDRVKVRAMLVNLLNNSIKYTKEGHVKFKANYNLIDNNKCKVIFEISDSGIGIKEDELPKIFEMFQRVDETNNTTTEGTGLGLSITKGYAELMGGSINVQSKYGEGTTFTLEIEQEIVNAVSLNESSDDSDYNENRKLHLQNVKILAVDDIDMNIKLIELIMMQYGVNIDTTLNGYEAVELCKDTKYDLILMDQMMPEIDGLQTMLKIRDIDSHYKQGSGCTIVALTANAIDGAKEELIRSGFDDYLSKPIDIPSLEKLLAKYLNKEQFYYTNE